MAKELPAADSDYRSNGEFRAGWRTLLASAVGIATGTTGLPFYTLSVFIAPLSSNFGWTQTEITASTIPKTLATIASFGLVGRLVDQVGVRRIALASLTLTALAFLAFLALNVSIWSFYLAWFVLTIAGAGTSPAVWTRGVSGWFDQHRGLAIGLTLLGTGISSALAPPLVEFAIDSGGWRMGYLALAAMTGLVGLPVVFALFREAPSDSTRANLNHVVVPPVGGVSLEEALRHRQFWQLGAAIFFAGGVITAVIIHLMPLLTDKGLARDQAVGMVSLLGIAIICGRVGVGFLIDRYFAPTVALACFLFCAIAFLAIATLGISSIAVLVVSVFIIGLSAGAEVDLLAYLITRYFGLRAYTEICGWLLVIFTLGSGLAPPVAAMAREFWGTYDVALNVGAAVLLVSAALFGTLGAYSVGPAQS